MRTRGPYDCSWILENIGSVFFLYTGDFCILGLTTVQSLCCRIFVKSKGDDFDRKVKIFITHVFQIQFQQF